MDKYIKREDLGEALNVIAAAAMENIKPLTTEISLRESWRGEGVVMTVKVRDAQTYKTFEETDYWIVANSDLDADVMFAEALDKKIRHDQWLAEQKVAAAAAKEQEVESNNEEE